MLRVSRAQNHSRVNEIYCCIGSGATEEGKNSIGASICDLLPNDCWNTVSRTSRRCRSERRVPGRRYLFLLSRVAVFLTRGNRARTTASRKTFKLFAVWYNERALRLSNVESRVSNTFSAATISISVAPSVIANCRAFNWRTTTSRSISKQRRWLSKSIFKSPPENDPSNNFKSYHLTKCRPF
jgi:hypothetical protein